MTGRLRRVTELPEWHLTHHFVRGMFDLGVLTPAGADSFKHMLLGATGGIIALGLLLTRVFLSRYAALAGATSPEPYRRVMLGDDLFLIGLPMLLVGFVTLLVSDALFPDRRDFRIVGALPVHRSAIFRAKLAALLIFNGLFISVAHIALVPLVLVTSMNPWREHSVLARLLAWAVVSVGASLFAVLAIAAVLGTVMLSGPRAGGPALSTVAKSVMLALLVSSVPVLLHAPQVGVALSIASWWTALLPTAWFVGLQRLLLGSENAWLVSLGATAVAALAAAAAVVALVYHVLFRDFELVALRATGGPLRPEEATIPAFSRASPAFRAVHRFTVTSLWRSDLHQTVLVSLSLCGAAIAVDRLAGWGGGWLPTAALADPRVVSLTIWIPFVLMFASGVALRASLALPLEQGANWIFRLTEDHRTRPDQLRAVERVVVIWVLVVPIAAAAPLLWLTLGPRAIDAIVVSALIGRVFVHGVLLDWRRIPFTCAYLPGKRFAAQSLLFWVFSFLSFTVVARSIVRAAIASRAHALAVVAALGVVAYLLRRKRVANWRQLPLMFEDECPDTPQPLRL